jgi:hypothetical protein
MSPRLKAIVFKTPRLAITKAFFENRLGMIITEFSAQHFVIAAKSIRVIFLQDDKSKDVELYIGKKKKMAAEKTITVSGSTQQNPERLRDPNGIRVIICEH